MFKMLMYLFKLSPFRSNKDFCCCALQLVVCVVLLDNEPREFWEISDSSSKVRFFPTKTVDLIRIQKLIHLFTFSKIPITRKNAGD